MNIRATTLLALCTTWGATAGLGCARSAASEGPDGGAVNPPPTVGSARDVAQRTAHLPFVAARLHETTGASAPGASLLLQPSAGASSPQRLTVAETPDFWVEITAVDLSGAPASHVDGHAVFVEAALDTDVVHVAAGHWFEEVRWLRGPNATPTIRERLHLGPAVASVRVREGHVELLSAGGRVELATAPLYAVDARGVVRTLRVDLEQTSGDPDPTLVATLDTNGLAYPVAVDPLWSTAASLTTVRTGGIAATAIGGGKAIVVGGTNAGGALTDVEIYDLATNTWSTVAPLKLARTGAAVTYLSGSKKVVALQGSGSSTSLEVYDVATNTWTDGAPLDAYRSYYGVAPTAAGTRVLLVDGTTKSEVYDVATKAWIVTGAMPVAHQVGFAMTPLPDGRVLVTGGGQIPPGPGGTNAKASLFTSSTAGGTWASATDMNDVRLSHGATVVGGTRVVVGGGVHVQGIASGWTTAPNNSTDVYDIAANTWTAFAPMAKSGSVYVAGLGNGRAYFFEPSYLEIYQPGSSLFISGGTTTAGSSIGVTLDASSVLVINPAGDANQLFRLYALGATCAGATDCASGNCVLGACCGTATCPAGYVCNGPTKPGVCGKALGATCGGSGECDSGFCVDGVCCNAACGGQCQACDVLGKTGTCSPVAGKPHGTRAACSTSTDPCVAQTCDGTDTTACHFPGGGTPCGAASCKDGIETHVGSCDGSGKCGDVPTACGSYSCGPTACKTTCGSPPDCQAGYYCDLTKATCVPLTGLGTACDAATPCGAGLFCTDGFCCGKAACGTGSSCGLSGYEGQCRVKNGFACTSDLQCGSAHCIDGTCCDSICSGQCEACDVKGAEGTCTPVKGKAHGARPACGSGAAACDAPLCDGAVRDRCAGFTGPDAECRAAGCKDGVATARATCDGKGACPAAITSSCDGFACDAAGAACLTACTADAECVGGYHCDAGKCSKKSAECNAAGDGVVQVDGTTKPCAPFRCRAGACIEACNSSDECQPGLVCSTDTKTCNPPPSGDSGGCNVTAKGNDSSSGGALVVLALLGALGALGRGGRRRARSSPRA